MEEECRLCLRQKDGIDAKEKKRARPKAGKKVAAVFTRVGGEEEEDKEATVAVLEDHLTDDEVEEFDDGAHDSDDEEMPAK